MASDPPVVGSGDGTRPTTDGGVDNIGAGEKFSTKRTPAGTEVSGGPAPKERMSDNRRDVEGTAHDDSSPFHLTEKLSPDTNKEKPPTGPTDRGS